jgi:hypothetical protein
VIAACAGGPSSARLDPTEDLMIGHYGRFGEIQASLVMGDLPAAQAAAQSLGNRPMPPTTTGWVDALKSAAHTVAMSSTIEEAAQASGDLILACGSCHLEVGARPNVRFAPGAPTGDSRAEHMARDMWALDQLMDGIVSGDSEYWMNGARALAEDNNLNLGDIGRQAMAATGEQRGVVYGRVLEACADCHTR